jgi:hypothetical protein
VVADRFPGRDPSRVGVVSTSSMADSFLAAPMLSRTLTSEALDARLEGNCLGMDFEAGGGMETLFLSTAEGAFSGSTERAFRLAGEALFPEARSCVVQLRDDSAEVVRERASMVPH